MKFTVKDTSAAFVAAMAERAAATQEASVLALNRTTVKVYNGLKDMLASKLDRPTRFTLNSLQFQKATPQKLYAIVETRLGFNSVPAGRYLSPLVYGGTREMKSHERLLHSYTTPSRFAPRDAYGNVPGSFYKKVLSQLKASSDPMQNATNSRRSKKKRVAESFFIAGNVILSKKGTAAPKPMLFLVRKVPTYKKMLPWDETAQEITDQSLPSEYYQALAELTR